MIVGTGAYSTKSRFAPFSNTIIQPRTRRRGEERVDEPAVLLASRERERPEALFHMAACWFSRASGRSRSRLAWDKGDDRLRLHANGEREFVVLDIRGRSV